MMSQIADLAKLLIYQIDINFKSQGLKVYFVLNININRFWRININLEEKLDYSKIK